MQDPQPIFRALADPTRREILHLLGAEDMTIGAVAEHFAMTRPAVKKHLKVLEAGHLITVRARGRERLNAIRPEGFRAAQSWLSFFDQFWDARLDALKTAIETEDNPDE